MCTCSKVRDLLEPIIITNFVSQRIVIMMVHARNTGYRPNIGLVSSTLLIVLPLQWGIVYKPHRCCPTANKVENVDLGESLGMPNVTPKVPSLVGVRATT